MSSTVATTVESDAIDLFAVSRVAWRHKGLVVLVCLGCGIVAAIVSLIMTPMFRAEVVVTEVHDRGMGANSSLASQLGGLASLAGVNLNTDNDVVEAQAVLDSRHLTEEFIKRNGLLELLFPDPKAPRSLWLAVRRFKSSVLLIRKDARKETTTVTIEWTDAATAARWANSYVALANELIRTRALEESSRNIAYLNSQLEHNNTVELRRAIYNLIESQTKQLMLANGRIEYAFEVVDPGVAPQVRSRPQRVLMVGVGLALGLFLGITGAFIVDSARRRAAAAKPRVA
jgi:uncharacterized protein involved in exopolysaccharide biosynthesis